MNAYVEPTDITFTPSVHAPFLQTAMVDIGNDIELCVEVGGDPKNPPILLIMGLGAQMIYWPEDFLEKLINAGYYVIRYDNRDIGLSTKIKNPNKDKNGKRLRPNFWRMAARSLKGKASPDEPLAYDLTDMADDANRLIDTLGFTDVHVIGASMGGMIAQILAAEYPEKVRTLGLLYTSNNRPLLPLPYPKQLKALLGRPKNHQPETLIAHGVKVFQAIGSPGHVDEKEAEVFSRRLHERSFHPLGYIQHLLAIVGTGSLVKYDKAITAPTIVVHGAADRLLPPAHGRAVARAINGASFHKIKGFGHDVAPAFQKELVSLFTSRFADVDATRAKQRSKQNRKRRLLPRLNDKLRNR